MYSINIKHNICYTLKNGKKNQIIEHVLLS